MKKIAAILLMGLMIFNIAGYRFTLQWMQQAQSRHFEQQLDAENYDESSLIEISVPLSLPYYNNWGQWERYDGEIQVGGQTWKYVKRKIEDGKLIVQCLPNPQQQIIQKNISIAFAQLNGLSASDPSAKAFKKIVKAAHWEYEALILPTMKKEVIISIEKPVFFTSCPPLQTVYTVPWHPPEFIS